MVSVIVPLYNAENTLANCIESILAQTYSRFELILVDDGSTDASGKICDEYAVKDSRIRVVHKANGGVSSARNAGMDNVQGEYFVCVDSDDVIEPCYLENLVATQENHPEFGHVLCGFYSVSQKKKYVLTEDELLSSVDRKDYMRLADCVLIQGPCLHLYRTEIVQRNKLRMHEDLSLAEDLTFNLEYLDALENTTIGVINKPNYIYCDGSENSLNRKYRDDLCELKEMVNSKVRFYLDKWEVADEQSWTAYYNSALYGYFNVLDNTFSELNHAEKRDKIAFNSSILQKKEFKEALNKSSVCLSTGLKKAYLTGNYRSVMAYEAISKIKHGLIEMLG